jgi:hypothetical protein
MTNDRTRIESRTKETNKKTKKKNVFHDLEQLARRLSVGGASRGQSAVCRRYEISGDARFDLSAVLADITTAAMRASAAAFGESVP